MTNSSRIEQAALCSPRLPSRERSTGPARRVVAFGPSAGSAARAARSFGGPRRRSARSGDKNESGEIPSRQPPAAELPRR